MDAVFAFFAFPRVFFLCGLFLSVILRGYPKMKKTLIPLMSKLKRGYIILFLDCGDSVFFGDGIIPEMFSEWQRFNFSGMKSTYHRNHG